MKVSKYNDDEEGDYEESSFGILSSIYYLTAVVFNMGITVKNYTVVPILKLIKKLLSYVDVTLEFVFATFFPLIDGGIYYTKKVMALLVDPVALIGAHWLTGAVITSIVFLFPKYFKDGLTWLLPEDWIENIGGWLLSWVAPDFVGDFFSFDPYTSTITPQNIGKITGLGLTLNSLLPPLGKLSKMVVWNGMSLVSIPLDIFDKYVVDGFLYSGRTGGYKGSLKFLTMVFSQGAVFSFLFPFMSKFFEGGELQRLFLHLPTFFQSLAVTEAAKIGPKPESERTFINIFVNVIRSTFHAISYAVPPTTWEYLGTALTHIWDFVSGRSGSEVISACMTYFTIVIGGGYSLTQILTGNMDSSTKRPLSEYSEYLLANPEVALIVKASIESTIDPTISYSQVHEGLRESYNRSINVTAPYILDNAGSWEAAKNLSPIRRFLIVLKVMFPFVSLAFSYLVKPLAVMCGIIFVLAVVGSVINGLGFGIDYGKKARQYAANSRIAYYVDLKGKYTLVYNSLIQVKPLKDAVDILDDKKLNTAINNESWDVARRRWYELSGKYFIDLQIVAKNLNTDAKTYEEDAGAFANLVGKTYNERLTMKIFLEGLENGIVVQPVVESISKNKLKENASLNAGFLPYGLKFKGWKDVGKKSKEDDTIKELKAEKMAMDKMYKQDDAERKRSDRELEMARKKSDMEAKRQRDKDALYEKKQKLADIRQREKEKLARKREEARYRSMQQKEREKEKRAEQREREIEKREEMRERKELQKAKTAEERDRIKEEKELRKLEAQEEKERREEEKRLRDLENEDRDFEREEKERERRQAREERERRRLEEREERQRQKEERDIQKQLEREARDYLKQSEREEREEQRRMAEREDRAFEQELMNQFGEEGPQDFAPNQYMITDL